MLSASLVSPGARLPVLLERRRDGQRESEWLWGRQMERKRGGGREIWERDLSVPYTHFPCTYSWIPHKYSQFYILAMLRYACCLTLSRRGRVEFCGRVYIIGHKGRGGQRGSDRAPGRAAEQSKQQHTLWHIRASRSTQTHVQLLITSASLCIVSVVTFSFDWVHGPHIRIIESIVILLK